MPTSPLLRSLLQRAAIGATLLASAALLRAEEDAPANFTRAHLFWVSPTDEEMEATTAFSFTYGHAFGAARAHAITAEVGYTHWEISGEVDLGPYGEWSASATQSYVPLLVGYRFRPTLGDPRVRLELGLSAGVTYVSLDASASTSGESASASEGSWSASWSAHAGISYALSRSWELEVAYKYLSVEESTLTFADLIEVDLPRADAHLVGLGVGYRF